MSTSSISIKHHVASNQLFSRAASSRKRLYNSNDNRSESHLRAVPASREYLVKRERSLARHFYPRDAAHVIIICRRDISACSLTSLLTSKRRRDKIKRMRQLRHAIPAAWSPARCNRSLRQFLWRRRSRDPNTSDTPRSIKNYCADAQCCNMW